MRRTRSFRIGMDQVSNFIFCPAHAQTSLYLSECKKGADVMLEILIACLIVLEIAMISMVWFHPDQPALVILGIVIGLPGFAALVALSCVTLFGGTPEETIESELRDGLKEARKP